MSKELFLAQVAKAKEIALNSASEKCEDDVLSQFIYITILKRGIDDALQQLSAKAIQKAVELYPMAADGKHFHHNGFELSCRIEEWYETLGSYSTTYREKERLRQSLQEQTKQLTKELKTLQSGILLEHPHIKPAETRITLAVMNK